MHTPPAKAAAAIPGLSNFLHRPCSTAAPYPASWSAIPCKPQHTCHALGVHHPQLVLGGGQVVGAGVTQRQDLGAHHVTRPEAGLDLDL